MAIQTFSRRGVATGSFRGEAVVWLNGRLLPTRDAGISPFDQGLLTGDGFFETLVAWGGRPFALHRHWLRLGQSAERFEIPAPGEELLRHAIDGVLHANQLADARVRVTVTTGDVPQGGGGSGSGPEPLVLMSAVPLTGWPPLERVALVPFTRDPDGALSGCKSVSYGDNMVALRWARARGAGEAVFGNTRGELCEGTGSNVFVVREGKLLTPPLESGCLAGVTRALALELARAGEVPVAEEVMPVNALAAADEAFLTSTTRGIQPVSHVDDRPLTTAAGPVTRRMQELWQGLIERNMEP